MCDIYNKPYIILFNKIYEWLHYTIPLVELSYSRDRIADDSYESTMNSDTSLYKYIPKDMTQCNSYQKLIWYLLDIIDRNGYRRYNKELYKRCYTNDGYYTYSWEKVYQVENSISSMELFIQIHTDKHLHFGQWLARTQNAKVIKDVASYLENTIDKEIIDIKKDRNIFSFKNGVYIAKIIKDNGKYDHFFYKYGSGECKYLNDKSVAVNYIDSKFKFKPLDEWRNIKTPVFQKIISHQFKNQKDPEQIYDIFYSVLGRLLYDVNDLDKWQIVPFIKGIGGTGKGMIINFISKIYKNGDVGTLADNIEKSFGLYPLSSKLLVVAPEVAELADNLKQSLFQSMVSGENVNTPIKGINNDGGFIWIVPMIMAGNELPNYINKGNSIGRRLFIIPFMILVPPEMRDSNLEDKLESELSNFLQKINCAYLSLLNKLNGSDIKTILPDYFLDTAKNVSTDTNTFNEYLESEHVEYGPEFYCHSTIFKKDYRQYCSQNGNKPLAWKTDMYSGILQQYSIDKGFEIKVEEKLSTRPDINGNIKKGRFIIGMRLLVNEDE